MNAIAKQTRENADAILAECSNTSRIPSAALAGGLQMAAGEIERLAPAADAWNRLVSKLMEKRPEVFNKAPSPVDCVLAWVDEAV
jgi:hypothetical protein